MGRQKKLPIPKYTNHCVHLPIEAGWVGDFGLGIWNWELWNWELWMTGME